MYQPASNPTEYKEPPYPKPTRENGINHERDWNTYRRPEFSRDQDREPPYENKYPRDFQRERDFRPLGGYKPKREWIEPPYPREYNRLPGELSPSAKRRKIEIEQREPPFKRDFKRMRFNDYNSPRSRDSTSPSKERPFNGGREYFHRDREDFTAPGRPIDYNGPVRGNPPYQRGPSWPRDYENRREPYPRDYRLPPEARRNYDRYDRDWEREKGRDYRDYHPGGYRERNDYDHYRDKNREKGSNYRFEKNDNEKESQERSDSAEMSDSYELNSSNEIEEHKKGGEEFPANEEPNTSTLTDTNSVVADSKSTVTESLENDQPANTKSPTPPPEPTPKKRLGFGQGLVKYEQQKEKKGSDLATPEQTNAENLSSKENVTLPSEQPIATTPSQVIDSTSESSIEVKEEVSSPRDPRQRPTTTAIKEETVEIKEKTPPPPPLESPPPVPLMSKDAVLHLIEKIDSEISKIEIQINLLKNPKKLDAKRFKYMTPIDRVQDENKKIVAETEKIFEHLLPPDLNCHQGPLYRKPSDLPIYHENLKSHERIKHHMAEVLRKRHAESQAKQENLSQQYKKYFEIWKKKVTKMEAKREKKEKKQQKKIAASSSFTQQQKDKEEEEEDLARRPILRSQVRAAGRRERSDAVRSEAEFDRILNELREEDGRDPNFKYLKTIATIPPMIVDPRQPKFIDNNGLVKDPLYFEKEKKLSIVWTEEEKDIFLKKFILYQKNFSKIASFLENKTTENVILYYYMNKKTLDLKRILRDQQSKKRAGRKPLGPTTTSNNLPRELQNLIISPNSNFWDSPTARRNIRTNETTDDRQARPSILGASEPETRWTDSERDSFLEALQKYGKDFKSISQHLGTKNQFQCKNYYHNYKKKLNLDQIIDDPNRNKTKEEKDEEEEEKERKKMTFWSVEEKENFLKYFKIYGKNWKKIGSFIPTKTQNQIKNYFQNSRNKLGLDKILASFKRDEPDMKKKEKRMEGKENKRKTKVAKSSDSSIPHPSNILPTSSRSQTNALHMLAEISQTDLSYKREREESMDIEISNDAEDMELDKEDEEEIAREFEEDITTLETNEELPPEDEFDHPERRWDWQETEDKIEVEERYTDNQTTSNCSEATTEPIQNDLPTQTQNEIDIQNESNIQTQSDSNTQTDVEKSLSESLGNDQSSEKENSAPIEEKSLENEVGMDNLEASKQQIETTKNEELNQEFSCREDIQPFEETNVQNQERISIEEKLQSIAKDTQMDPEESKEIKMDQSELQDTNFEQPSPYITEELQNTDASTHSIKKDENLVSEEQTPINDEKNQVIPPSESQKNTNTVTEDVNFYSNNTEVDMDIDN